MTVFTEYSESELPALSVWISRWRGMGWTPQLLSARERKAAGGILQAMKRRDRRGVYTPCRLINLGFKPTRGEWPEAVHYGQPGWEKAPLVLFSPEDDIVEALHAV